MLAIGASRFIATGKVGTTLKTDVGSMKGTWCQSQRRKSMTFSFNLFCNIPMLFNIIALHRQQSRYKFPIWLGLRNAKEEGDFRWSDGSNLTFTQWSSGESNSYKGTFEYCITMQHDRKWHATSICERGLSYVCMNNEAESMDELKNSISNGNNCVSYVWCNFL